MAAPTASAGVVLTRGDADDPQIYWARRPVSATFLGGFYSYFVGKLVPDDDHVDLDADQASLEVDRSFYGAAVRELREECGLHIDPNRLVHLGGWPSPTWLDGDYRTEFFWRHFSADEARRLDLDGLAERVDPGEIDRAEWLRPASAIAEWQAGRARMTTPLSTILAIFEELSADARPGALDRRRARLDPNGPIEVVGGIRMLGLKTATLPPATHTNGYLVGRDGFIVVDPGSDDPGELELLNRAVDGLIERGMDLVAVVLTHHHRDHVAGVDAFCGPRDVPVWAHRRTADRLDDIVVARTLADDQCIDLGQDTVRCVHTPGHAPGHLCLYHRRTNSVLAGDLVASTGTIVIDPPDGHMGDYMTSLERIRAMQPRTLFAAHGATICDPEALLGDYLEHRRDRERQILEALNRQGQPVTPTDLVPEVYDDLPAHIWPLAARSLLAHLIHLAEAGRAERHGKRFRAC